MKLDLPGRPEGDRRARHRGLEAAAVTAATVAFVGLGLYHLEAPGLYHDELLFIAPAIGSGPWRFMIMTYVGALKAVLWVPIFALWEVSPASVRIPALLISASTLVVQFGYLRRLVGPVFAIAGLLILSIDPMFAFMTRMGAVLVHVLKACALLLLLLWLESGRARLLWALVVVLVLGLYDKLNFVWFINAATVATVVAHHRRLVGLFRERPWAFTAPLLTLAAVVGAAFVFFIRPLLPETRSTLGAPMDYAARVPYILATTRDMVDGVDFYNWVARYDRMEPTAVFWVLHAAIVLNGLVLIAQRRRAPPVPDSLVAGRWLVFLLVCYVAMLAQMVFTRAAYGAHNAMLAWPLPHLAAVLSAALALRVPGPRGPRRLLAAVNALALAWILVAQSTTTARYLRFYRGETEMNPVFSTRIYDLAAYVNQRLDRVESVVCLDPGLAQPLRALAPAEGRERIRNLWHVFQTAPSISSDRDLRRFLRGHLLERGPVLAIAPRAGDETYAAPSRHWRAFVEQHLGARVRAHREQFGLYELWCIGGKGDCGLRD